MQCLITIMKQKFTIMKKLFILLLSVGTATAVFASSNSVSDHGYGFNRNGGMYSPYGYSMPYGYNTPMNHSNFGYGYNNRNNSWNYNNRRFYQERTSIFDRGYGRGRSFFRIMIGGRVRH